MSSLAERAGALEIACLGPDDGQGEPLGTAYLARNGRGIDLEPYGYVETEWLVSGQACPWVWDQDSTGAAGEPLAFVTRVLVRAPADPERFSGAVQIEPHHPDDDRALSWAQIAPWILRSGHAHVGVTQEPAVIADLQEWDPERYASLSLPDSGMRWEIVGLIASAIRHGSLPPFGDLAVDRAFLSGWSMTGTFCRTFLGEGFHEASAGPGGPAIDGYVICISSGGAGRAGYGSPGTPHPIPLDDPRRRVGGHDVPVFELLSESESETHGSVMRPDSDAPEDPYRFYGVAGSGHINGGVPDPTTNRVQRRERGAPSLPREIVEATSDGRMDAVARGVFALMDRWVAEGTVPPHAEPFAFAESGPHGHMPESRPLARDADANVLGGVRTPWVTVPLAGYLPHSTPAPGRCLPAEHAPYSDPALLADLIAHMEPFSPEELRRRYTNSENYLLAYTEAVRDAVAAGWLLAEDSTELIDDKARTCGSW